MSTQNGNGDATPRNPGAPNGSALRDPEARALVANLIMYRAELMRQSLEPGRDLDKDCGYPEEPTPGDYQKLYDRLGPATRVVQVYPRECWQVQPTVYEDEDPDVVTTFEEAWDELGQSLRSDRSFYQDEAGSPVWEYLLRADELSGVGQYGAILLGLNDGLPLNEPAQFVGPAASILRDPKGKFPVDEPTQNYRRKLLGSKKPRARRKGIKPPPAPHKARLTFNQPAGQGQGRRLTFIRIFPETAATISKFDEDLSSPRFGQPTEYSLTFASPVEVEGRSVNSSTVHWTRIIHVADNLAANEIYGVPRQRPVFNNLLDLRKLYGGSAEMYWRGAFPGYALESLPQFGTEVDYDEEKINSMMFKWSAGLQRHLLLTGLSMKGLSPQVVDPRSQIEVHIEAICIQLGIPVRVFKGTERGELASSQDDAAWNDRLRQRQSGYLTPRLIVPFVDRLIALGVLPAPAGYSVWWPDLTSQSEQEQSDIATARTGSVVQYGDSEGARATIAPHDYWTRIQGYSEEEAGAIVDAAEKERKRLEAEKKKADEEALAQQTALLDQQRQAAEAKARANGTSPPGGPPQAGGGGNAPPGGNLPPKPPTGNQDGSAGNVDWDFEEDIPLEELREAVRDVSNAFCPTGEGGGVDPTCSPGGGKSAPSFTSAKDRGAAAAYAKETHGEWAANLTNEQKAALKVYAGHSYTELNQGLRGDGVPESLKKTVKDLDAAIAAAPPTKVEMTVYRGVGEGVAKKLKVGAEFSDRGYTSTSHNKHVGENFAEDALIEVKIPVGTRMASMDASGQAHLTGEKSENEYVLGRRTKYRVTGKREDRDAGLTVITVEVVQ